MKETAILIPTYNRLTALSTTLTSLISQSYTYFDVVISDQSEQAVARHPTIQAIQRILELQNHSVEIYHHLPKRGLAEQRDFLLSKSQTKYSLFIDDDVILESWVLENLINVINKYQIGFVGMPIIGLSFKDDKRPEEQEIEFWNGEITPETITPQSKEWQRAKLHNAANMYHVQRRLDLSHNNPKPYKIAWVGGCVVYDTDKLKDSGGFSFWQQLPPEHAGEDVMAQLQVMKKYGGCAILPSGAYHQELKTAIPDRRINAPEYLIK